MKKIVMGIAAVAMAASMFAADVAGKLVYNTNIYADKAMFTKPVKAYDNNNTQLTFAANGDVAGASLMLSGAVAATFDGATALWFKPVDAVKLTIGGIDTGSINRGTFAWWARTLAVASDKAILLNTNVAGVGIEFASFGDALLDFSKKGYDVIGDYFLNLTYGLGDAGNLGFAVSKGGNLQLYGVGGWGRSASLAMCLSYDHMPWQTTGFYADALVNLNMAEGAASVFDMATIQAGGQYVADGLALRLVTMFVYNGDKSMNYGFVAKASYNIEGWEPYIQILGNGIKNKAVEFEAGTTKGFGAAAINCRFSGKYDGSAFTWSIPCEISCGL